MKRLALIAAWSLLAACSGHQGGNTGGGSGGSTGGGGNGTGGGHAGGHGGGGATGGGGNGTGGGGNATGGGGTASGGGQGQGGGLGAGGGSVMPRVDGGWCEQPGAWVHDDAGYHDVTLADGGRITELRWLRLPPGFCAHTFANVGNVRQIRFAPGGELFAASPTMGTTSGGGNGRSAIIVLPDDNHDGLADSTFAYRNDTPQTQGLLFWDGGFYYQMDTRILREPYVRGQRVALDAGIPLVNITVYTDIGHWPKTLDVSDNGTVYVTNGGTQGETCDPARPFHGGVLSIDGSPGGHQVAKGLRNPIYVRCHHDGHNLCFANELARDYSSTMNGREKLLPVREGDDWGYPCCAGKNLPYLDTCLPCSTQTETQGNSTATCTSQSMCSPKCGAVVAESASFVIGDTPFGLDFVDGQFPAPWDHRVYIAVHGAFGTWEGARVAGIAFEPSTGQPLPGSNLPGVDAGAMADFLTGWDDGQRMHGRPADVTVSPDGRLFVANDWTGEIFWIAPIGP